MEKDKLSVPDQPHSTFSTATFVPENVVIDKLLLDGGTQTRAALNQGSVKDYADLTKAQGATALPPIIVYQDEAGQYWLADGFHRVAAAQKINWTTIRAEVRSGSRLDALTYSLGANLAHGVRRTNADKRRSVEIVLAEEAFRGRTDNSLADLCGVSNHFVTKVRSTLVNEGRQQVGTVPTSNGFAKRTGKDNKSYPVGKRRQKNPAVQVQPMVERSLTLDKTGGKKIQEINAPSKGKTSDTIVGTEPTSAAAPDNEDRLQVGLSNGESQKPVPNPANADTNVVAEAVPSTPAMSSTNLHFVDDGRWDDGVLSADEIRARLELLPRTHRCPSAAEQETLQDCFLEIARTINRLAETVCAARSVHAEIALNAAKIVGSHINTRPKPSNG